MSGFNNFIDKNNKSRLPIVIGLIVSVTAIALILIVVIDKKNKIFKSVTYNKTDDILITDASLVSGKFDKTPLDEDEYYCYVKIESHYGGYTCVLLRATNLVVAYGEENTDVKYDEYSLIKKKNGTYVGYQDSGEKIVITPYIQQDYYLTVSVEGSDYEVFNGNYTYRDENEDPESEYIFKFSDARYLYPENLAFVSAYLELRCGDEVRKYSALDLGRCEIYARHGYIFEDEFVSEYFKGKKWYEPEVTAEEFDENVFNDYEKKNIDFLWEQAEAYRDDAESGIEDGRYVTHNYFYLYNYEIIGNKKHDSEYDTLLHGYCETSEIIPDSSDRLLVDDDVKSLTNVQLIWARNEIYARHGYLFGGNAVVCEYFIGKTWYEPLHYTEKFSDSMLSDIERKNIELIRSYESDEKFTIITDNGFIFPNSSEEYLTENDVKNLTNGQLVLARNEIYARHGYIFEDDFYSYYYMELSWYEPQYSSEEFSYSMLNDIERKNIELIGKYESDEDSTIITNDSFIFANSSEEYLTENDVKNLTNDQLMYARNEIYARHGYIFNDPELSDYFTSQSWYVPQYTSDQFSEDMLNDVEKANIKLIKSYEK